MTLEEQIEFELDFCLEGIEIVNAILNAKTDEELAHARWQHEEYKIRAKDPAHKKLAPVD